MILCLKRNVLFHQQSATQRIMLKQQSSVQQRSGLQMANVSRNFGVCSDVFSLS